MGDARSFYVRPPNYLVTSNLRPTRYGRKKITKKVNSVQPIEFVEKVVTNPTGILLNVKTGKPRWIIYGLLTTIVVVGYILFQILYVVPWLNDEKLNKEDSEYSVVLAITVYTLVVIVYRMLTKMIMLKTKTKMMDIMLTLIVAGFSIVRLTWLLDTNMNYNDPRRLIFVIESWISVISLSILAFMILLLGGVVGGNVDKIKISR